jgi:CheY-like chemotaxis protein
MDIDKLITYYNRFKYGEDLYHNLMQKRVKKILLISTFYNAFVLEEESKFSEQIIGGYHQFNLTSIPKIKNAINASHALKITEKENFDLVISTLRIGEPGPFKLAKKIKQQSPETSFTLLFTESFDLKFLNNKHFDNVDNTFLWSGDPSLFLSMIKLTEDKWNAASDTETGGVTVILLVEDSINFYSIYLPEIYKILMTQTQKLIEEEANNDIKYLRMRTRPKILLAKNFLEAKFYFEKYKDYLLSVITDMELGDNKNAGMEIIDFVKKETPDIPILAQSSDSELLKKAREKGVEISHKNTPFVLNDFNMFLKKTCGFGDFVFRDSKGNEIAVAKTFNEFEKLLSEIPIDSFKYHAKRKHFCMWLVPRRELTLVKKLRKVKPEKFKSPEQHRKFLVNIVKNIKIRNQRGKILDFNGENFNEKSQIFRIGDGSLGGKGRGLSFLNALFSVSKLNRKFKDSVVTIPKTFIITTNYFDEFIYDNYLFLDYDFHTDREITEFFLEGKLSSQLKEYLKQLLKSMKQPIIVRSSGLLEDSQFHPFAGVYKSVILPNCSGSFEKRFKQLEDAIKLVYASVYFKDTRAYIERIGLKLEEEKMAVIIQEVVGEQHGGYFYPHFAGVAQSFNYYPLSHMEKKDGVASIALGLGKYVVEGEKCYRFCPKYPEIRYLTEEDTIKLSQTYFYALDLKRKDLPCNEEESFIVKLPLEVAEKHGTLNHIASTYNISNGRIEPGIYAKGPRIINFDNILIYESFPFSSILKEILELAEYAVGTPVETEFAATISNKLNFNILQVRPLITHEEGDMVEFDKVTKEHLLLYTETGCGNGVVDYLKNIVFLEPDNFDKTLTLEMKKEIGEINKTLKEKGEEYILIAPGRWGSRDRFLGIPVNWEDINAVKVIVESGIKDFDIDPSQGTHFIHNIISMNIGYFNVSYYSKENNFIDWEWLKSQPTSIEKKFFKVITLNPPVKVFMDGKNGKYAILKKCE